MTKLIFFDLDGTLMPTNSWHFFNLAFGMTEAEDQQMFDWYKRGILSYSDWEELLSKILREKNMCTKEKVAVFVPSIIPRSEAKDLIDACRDAGYISIILSGTTKQLAEGVRAKLGMDYAYTTSELMFDENDVFTHIQHDTDEGPAKLRIFGRICAEHCVDPTETIMVGDGGNDVEIFKLTKKGIQIGTYEKLTEYAWKKIENLSEIKDLI